MDEIFRGVEERKKSRNFISTNGRRLPVDISQMRGIGDDGSGIGCKLQAR